MHGQDYARNPDSLWALSVTGRAFGGPAHREAARPGAASRCCAAVGSARPHAPVTCTDARKGAPLGPPDRSRRPRQGGDRLARIPHGRRLLRPPAGRVLAGAGLPRRPEEIQNLQAEDMPGGMVVALSTATLTHSVVHLRYAW